MSIVIEGIDASGKSTLISKITSRLQWPVQPSEGPPKHRGEMSHRIVRYSAFSNGWIFDRHPIVSQPIYGTLRPEDEDVDPHLIDQFYRAGHIFVYCDPVDSRSMVNHRRSVVDTDHHLAQVQNNYERLLDLYRVWAARHAHLIYRIGDDKDRLIKAISAMI